MQHRSIATLAIAMVFTLAAVPAQGQWSDNFDSYPKGGLIGNGGWEGWDMNPAADGVVTNAQSRSAPNSFGSLTTTDVVQQFSGATSGMWTLSGWCLIPSGSTGTQYFILLNTYAPGGPNNWSTQMVIDSDAGVVRDFDNPGPTVPIVNDQWVEVRAEIDLDADIQVVYYNNTELMNKSWSDGASGGGATEIHTLDLFSDGGSPIFWDDLQLVSAGATPVQATTWGKVKSQYR